MYHYFVTDDAHERLSSLIKARLPWLLVGLAGGILATILVSKFENLISQNIALVFFLPIIVYLSDAIGTQTENIYVRDLAKFKDDFLKYLFKEIAIGLFFGTLFGLLLAIFAKIWLGSNSVALTIGITMFINSLIAPILALVIPELLFKEKTDPALGAGPFTTVIQDLTSIVVYFIIAAMIIL